MVSGPKKVGDWCGAGGVGRDRQEGLRPGWQGAGEASRFDSSPALSRGEGREEERERRRPDNRGGELRGGTREGSGPQRDTSAGASRAARRDPGGLQAPPPPPPLTDSASSPHSSRTVRGQAGARAERPARASASASAQAAAGEEAGGERAGAAAPGRAEVAREVAGPSPQARSVSAAIASAAAAATAGQPWCDAGPSDVSRPRRAGSGTGASRDSWGLGPGCAADWRAAPGGGALRQLADG